MRKISLAVLLLFAVVISFAQDSRRPTPPLVVEKQQKLEAKAKKATDQIVEKLGLNAVQKDKLYALTVSFYNEKESLSSLKATDGVAYKAKMKEKAAYYVKQTNAIFTPEQQKTFAAMIEEHEKQEDK